MSLKGGYQIINLKNREFSTTRNNLEYYKDIYFNLLNSHAKMIIVSGLNMDGVKYNDYETIFYEVEQTDDNPYFQCIARRIWNTKDYKCITKYINIYSDDRVMCTQEEFTYEILPDGEMSLTSTNALQNKVITQNINRIDRKNESQDSEINLINEKLVVTTNEVTVKLYSNPSYKELPEDDTTTISKGTLTYDYLGNFTLRFTVQRSSDAEVGFIDVLNGIDKTSSIDGWAIVSRTGNIIGHDAMSMRISPNISEKQGFGLFGYDSYIGDSVQTINLGQGNNEILIIGKFTLNWSN